MNKKVLVILSIVVGLLLVGGGVMAYNNNQNDKKEQEKMAMEKKATDEAMMKNEAAAMEKEKMAKEGIISVERGMWQSSLVLLPIGIFMVYKATHDSALFDMDSYKSFFKKLFRKKTA